MKIFLSLLFAISVAEAKCDFQPHIEKVFSFSGTVTVVLKELGLLKSPKVKGISVFSPITKNEYSGTFYPGGVFLSQNTVNEFENGIVFYDESRELTKTLKQSLKIRGQEIKTRNLVPKEAMLVAIKNVERYLLGCEKNISILNKKTDELEKKLLQKIKYIPVVFYLGEIKQDKLPELVIVQDGVVKLLIERKKVKSYPSDLAYVNWSSKIINEMPKDTLHVGVKDSGGEGTKEVKRSTFKMTLTYPGALVPGITQLEAFIFWLDEM